MKCLSLSFLVAVLILPVFSHAEDAEAAGPEVVGKIVKVELAIQESEPPNLQVTATGEVPTAGFKKPRLNRVIYVTPPEDGIQDYFLTAIPPSGPAATVVSQITATDTWKGNTKEADWVKGVRVHGIGKGVMVKMLDGGKKK